MNNSDKMILAIIAMLLGLVVVMGTSCSTNKHCSGYSSQLMTAKYVKHSDFAKKRYNLN